MRDDRRRRTTSQHQKPQHIDDDSLIIGDDPVLVLPGEYDAICVQITPVERFQRVSLEFLFQVVSEGAAYQTLIPGYCPLASRNGRHSKIVRWRRVITAYTKGSPSKVTAKAFKQYLYRVRIETVTQNYLQQPLPLRDQYSKVTEIVPYRCL